MSAIYLWCHAQVHRIRTSRHNNRPRTEQVSEADANIETPVLIPSSISVSAVVKSRLVEQLKSADLEVLEQNLASKNVTDAEPIPSKPVMPADRVTTTDPQTYINIKPLQEIDLDGPKLRRCSSIPNTSLAYTEFASLTPKFSSKCVSNCELYRWETVVPISPIENLKMTSALKTALGAETSPLKTVVPSNSAENQENTELTGTGKDVGQKTETSIPLTLRRGHSMPNINLVYLELEFLKPTFATKTASNKELHKWETFMTAISTEDMKTTITLEQVPAVLTHETVRSWPRTRKFIRRMFCCA